MSPPQLELLAVQPPPRVGQPTAPPSQPRQLRRPRRHMMDNNPTIPPPYPWATDRRAKILTLEQLKNSGLTTITGEVECSNCQRQYDISYDLETKFTELINYMLNNAGGFNDRAPEEWHHPKIRCRYCGNRNPGVKPIIEHKRTMNWLFLLLGQMIGHCKLSELKYYCKHVGVHRTGAKNRLIYSIYCSLCRQLRPDVHLNA